ncbi:MAG: hypothetical protein Q7T14_09160 [Aestuariivirga sp.]|nr:hypothetical protein [Aestuariivirga sp.]
MQASEDIVSDAPPAWPLSVLAKASPAMVRLHPFPHLVIEDALDPALFTALSATFPDTGLFLEDKEPGNNKYFWLRAHRAIQEPKVHQFWKDFVKFHTSNEFFQDVLRVFEDVIAAEYPALAPRSWSAAMRFVDGPRDVSLDCIPVYCSPVIKEETSSRGPHLDREVSLYGGLLYMRMPDDDSKGGDFVVHTSAPDVAAAEYDSGNHLLAGSIGDFDTIKYKANTLVFFINTARAIHSVTPRSKTPYPRLHVSILGELASPLFSINKPVVGTGQTNAWYGNR